MNDPSDAGLTAEPTTRVIVFTRYPEPGKTKTRMIPALGPDGAARLQIALTKQSLRTVSDFCDQHSCEMEVRFVGGDRVKMAGLFGGKHHYRLQTGGDLGQRIANAVAAAFNENIRRIMVIGSDCPELDGDILGETIQELKQNDLVIGPALDGGYYLIGLCKNQPQLFQGIAWGSDQVLRQTLAKARQAQLRIHRLRPLADIDRPDDLTSVSFTKSVFRQNHHFD